jgi:hypothetical protein
VLWWLAQVGLSALEFAIVERVTRRLLPLAELLMMTLVFPDRAPSRLAVARRVGRTKDLAGLCCVEEDKAAPGALHFQSAQMTPVSSVNASATRRCGRAPTPSS